MSPKHGTRLSKETHARKKKLTGNFHYRKGEIPKLDHLTAYITVLQLMVVKKDNLRRNCLCGLADWKSRHGAGFGLGSLWDIYTTEPLKPSFITQGTGSKIPHLCSGKLDRNEFGSQTYRAGWCGVTRTSHSC